MTARATSWRLVAYAGAADFVKTLEQPKLIKIVDKHIHRTVSGPHASSQKRNNSGTWIAESKAVRELEMMVQQVADTKASVLILGKNSTGKSLLAQRCYLSSRRNSPFVLSTWGIPTPLKASYLTRGLHRCRKADLDVLNPRSAAPCSWMNWQLPGYSTQTTQGLTVSLSRWRSPAQVADVRVISATNADLNQMVQTGSLGLI